MGDVRVKLNLSGVKEVLNNPGVVADITRRAEAIATQASANAREHYKNVGYDGDIYVSKVTKTRKRGNTEAIVFANPGMHTGTVDNPGAPIGDYAQSRYSALTQAIGAGRG